MHDRSISLYAMILDYLICGIRIRCDIPFDVQFTEESLPFLCSFDEPDVTFTFIPVQELHIPYGSGTWMTDRYYVNVNGYPSVYYCPVRSEPPYAHVYSSDHSANSMICEYVGDHISYMCYSKNILDLIGIETLLLHFSSFILHSSFINWNGKAILFSAPSGTGKSTQADLWKKYRNADVINGDRSGIKFINDEWHAFGLPVAGSSGIYKNEHFPILALVFLKQAAYNEVYELSFRQAIRLIFPEISIHRWDESFVQRILDIAERFLLQIPVYMLECLPDEGAVCALEAKLPEGGNR